MDAGGKNTSLETEIKNCINQNKNELQNYLIQITNFQNQLLNKLNSIQTNFQSEIDSIKIKLNAIDQTNAEIKQTTTKNSKNIKLLQEQVEDLKRHVTSNFTDTNDLLKVGNKAINDVKRCVPTINQINQDIISLKADINNKVSLSNPNQSVPQTNISQNQSLANNQNSQEQYDRYALNYILVKDALPLKFNFEQSNITKYDGILKYLNSKFGNPFEQQIIGIKGQFIRRINRSLKNLGNLDNTTTYQDKYIQFDFKGFRFSYKGIEMQDLSQEDKNIKKNYILEGSHHGKIWQRITSFETPFPSFSSSNAEFSDNYYRYFKIRLSDPNQTIKLNKIELYGILENKLIHFNKIKIEILIVIVGTRLTIDFGFIDYLNHNSNTNYFIHYIVVLDNVLKDLLKNDSDYLCFFDIVVLGGCDEFGRFCNGLTTNVLNLLKKYHNESGILLFLHDMTWDKFYNIFTPFVNLLGFRGNNPTITTPSFRVYNNVVFNSKSGKDDIVSVPFYVGNKFSITPSHHTAQYDPRYIVVNYEDGESFNYYTENLDENFADCQMGHDPAISNNEKKFFYNVICHLYDSCKNHNVKTIL